jgi:hypothetical protein
MSSFAVLRLWRCAFCYRLYSCWIWTRLISSPRPRWRALLCNGSPPWLYCLLTAMVPACTDSAFTNNCVNDRTSILATSLCCSSDTADLPKKCLQGLRVPPEGSLWIGTFLGEHSLVFGGPNPNLAGRSEDDSIRVNIGKRIIFNSSLAFEMRNFGRRL